jgi:hypothetical protein
MIRLRKKTLQIPIVTQFTENGTDVTVTVTVMNDNIEVSCVAKATKMWYFDAVFLRDFYENIPCFLHFFTVIFYGPYSSDNGTIPDGHR